MGTSQINVYYAIAHITDARTRTFGDVNVPVEKTGESATTGRFSSTEITVPASGQAVLWDGTLTGAIRDWSVLAVAIDSGTLEMVWLVDTPVSESDLSASGSNPKALPDSMSCAVPFWKDNTRIRMNADNTKSFGTTGGTPNLFSNEATNALFKRYKLYAWNRETSAVVARVAVMD